MERDRILETLEACYDIFVLSHGPQAPMTEALERAIEMRKRENADKAESARRVITHLRRGQR
jgi:hypothetical protein